MDYGKLKSKSENNQTNSNDPQSVRSRVFVGNLNTEKCSREYLQSIFSKYGPVLGASVMKGYGFVQFADEYTARHAAQSEDGSVYFGQQVDCNLACEPKAKHGKGSSGGGGRKRKADGDGNEGEYDYASDYWSAAGYPGMGGVAPLMGQPVPPMMYPPGYPPQMDPAAAWYAAAPPPPPAGGPQPLMDSFGASAHPKGAAGTPKKPKTFATSKRDSKPGVVQYPHLDALKKKQSAAASGKAGGKLGVDIVICGRCKMQFSDVEKLVTHKRETPQCSTRSVCTCEAGTPTSLGCNRCEVTVASAWALLLHYREAHGTELCKGLPAAETEMTSS